MEMSFNSEDGKRATLKGMTGDAPRVVTAKRMQAIFGREQVAYTAECLIMDMSHEGRRQYSSNI
jgi:hypothetical protein